MELKVGRSQEEIVSLAMLKRHKKYDFILINTWKRFKRPIAHAIDAHEILPPKNRSGSGGS